jgi:hypothetical protein
MTDLSRRNVMGAAAGGVVAAAVNMPALAAGEQPAFGPAPRQLSGRSCRRSAFGSARSR